MYRSGRHSLQLVPSLAFLIVLVLASPRALAYEATECDLRKQPGGGTCYGIELTFTPEAGLKSAKSEQESDVNAGLNAWREHVLKERCGVRPCWIEDYRRGVMHCQRTSAPTGKDDDEAVASNSYFRVCIYKAPSAENEPPEIWYYDVTRDVPAIEVNAPPLNQRSLRALKDDGTLATIWSAAAASKMQPHPYRGGGHIHIDYETGFVNLLQAVNFVTRIQNLRVLPLSPNLWNMALWAAPLSMVGPAIRKNYRVLVERVGKGDFATFAALRTAYTAGFVRAYIDTYLEGARGKAKSVKEVNEKDMPAYPSVDDPRVMHWDRYYTIDEKNEQFSASSEGDKRVAVKMHAIDTIELRSIAPQKNPEDLLLQIEMLGLVVGDTPSTGAPIPLLDDGQLALGQTDADVVRYWKTSVGSFVFDPARVKRFAREDATLSDDEARSVALAFWKFLHGLDLPSPPTIANTSRRAEIFNGLKPYMPAKVVEQIANVPQIK